MSFAYKGYMQKFIHCLIKVFCFQALSATAEDLKLRPKEFFNVYDIDIMYGMEVCSTHIQECEVHCVIQKFSPLVCKEHNSE